MRIFLLFCLFLSAFLTACALAQFNMSDSVTITTYYPAPHGIYNTMKVKKMVVGDAQYANATFAGALTLKPFTNPPAANTQPVGTIYFDADEGILKFYNGTGGWQPLAAITPQNLPAGSWAGFVQIDNVYSQISNTRIDACTKIVAPGKCTCGAPIPHSGSGYTVQCTASCDSGWMIVVLSRTASLILGGIQNSDTKYSCFKN